MSRIAIIGAGIAGVTTAYALAQRGYQVTVFERHRYVAMETSFANGGQLSASNAEVWNSRATVFKGLRWMFTRDAPLLMNPRMSWHKYSWMGEFLRQIPHYRSNTIGTVRLAIAAREHLFAMAEREHIDFDLDRRGILHFYQSRKELDAAAKVNALLTEGGLDRRPVTPDEIQTLEPTLHGQFHGGFYTASDSTGDIYKFTRGLAQACVRLGVEFRYDTRVRAIAEDQSGCLILETAIDGRRDASAFDILVICAGVGSREFASMVGDHVNVYPVKGYSITVSLDDAASQLAAPWVSLLDDNAKIVTSRLGADRFRVAGTAELNGVIGTFAPIGSSRLCDGCGTIFQKSRPLVLFLGPACARCYPACCRKWGRGSVVESSTTRDTATWAGPCLQPLRKVWRKLWSVQFSAGERYSKTWAGCPLTCRLALD